MLPTHAGVCIVLGMDLLATIAAASFFERFNGYSNLPVRMPDWAGYRLPLVTIDQAWTLDRFGRWTRGNHDTLLPA